MRLNKQFVGQHPAQSGYILDFYVAENDPIDYISGSGSYHVRFPQFSVENIEFRGKNTLFETGTADNPLLLDDMDLLEESIELKCSFAGDVFAPVLDSETLITSTQLITGGAARNIKRIEVHTGDSSDFQPDIINFSDRIKSVNLNITEETADTTSITIEAEDIQDRIEEDIFYKIIPMDYLTFGQVSDAVVGKMFSGFSEITSLPFSPTITTSGDQIVNGVEANVIGRSNARDLEVHRSADIIQIFTGVRIILESGIPRDFGGSFRLRTQQEVFISGSGIPLNTSLPDASFDVVTTGLNSKVNQIRLVPGQEFGEFTISSLVDSAGIVEAMFIA